MFKKTIFILVAFVMMVFVALFLLSMHQAKHLHRDPHALMDKYFRLKKINPAAAQTALKILLSQDSAYSPALNEIHQEQKQLNAQNPSKQDQIVHAAEEPLQPRQTPALNVPTPVAMPMASLYPLHSSLQNSPPILHAQTLVRNKTSDQLLQQFYTRKAQNKDAAAKWVAATIHQHPNQVMLLKEAGFLAIEQHRTKTAIHYFSQAYALTYEPSLAMQLGYLYATEGNLPKAYQYFRLASRSNNPSLDLRAEKAMTNLAGLQTKALPAPYFAEAFFSPFYQSRFSLAVNQLIARVGIEQNNALHTNQYVFLRRTDDNKSRNLGQLSQIYEDNVQITGVGGQITPIQGVPIVGFMETGIAYDLVYRNRDRWRGDLRGGFMYYNQFGASPTYVDHPVLSTQYYSDLYGEVTYFSRYNNNVIAGAKTHQGIRLLQYHSSMVNLYATGRVIADTQRQFFNNFAEIGPGIEFIPTNRFNVKILFEHVNGVYLPAGATPNPYGQYYTNNVVQLLMYVKI